MIKTTMEYMDAVQKALDLLALDPALDTEEGRELTRLCTEINAYEMMLEQEDYAPKEPRDLREDDIGPIADNE